MLVVGTLWQCAQGVRMCTKLLISQSQLSQNTNVITVISQTRPIKRTNESDPKKTDLQLYNSRDAV